MPTEPPVTKLLNQWCEGDEGALAEVIPYIEKELSRQARARLRKNRRDHTLQPTALINEMWLRLIPTPPKSLQSKAHFGGIAAKAMRNVLVDYERSRNAEKRGGGQANLQLDEARDGTPPRGRSVVDIDEAITALAKVDARKAEAVTLFYFGGMEQLEIAQFLGLSVATVKRDLEMGKAWLGHYLNPRR